jgi:EAL domain-containing protein (putative c-di-GMP-specific phosphodiesterase class I)
MNVAARQFESPDFAKTVAKALADHGLSGNDLELEITEGVLMRDSERMRGTFTELRKLGIRMTIDDFGTGYSALAYLKRFPISAVKIDRSLLGNLAHDERNRELVVAVIAFARSLRLDVVAEGVETTQQVAFLRREHCSMIQGFHVARPADAAETTRWLAGLTRGGVCWAEHVPVASAACA